MLIDWTTQNLGQLMNKVGLELILRFALDVPYLNGQKNIIIFWFEIIINYNKIVH